MRAESLEQARQLEALKAKLVAAEDRAKSFDADLRRVREE
jgi:hypothetical protein